RIAQMATQIDVVYEPERSARTGEKTKMALGVGLENHHPARVRSDVDDGHYIVVRGADSVRHAALSADLHLRCGHAPTGRLQAGGGTVGRTPMGWSDHGHE